jgi:hypothetical protein
MRDLAPKTAFARDPDGSTFLIGGTAIIPEDPLVLDAMMMYINSCVANWYLSTTASLFQGSYLRFDPGQLSKLPVPEAIVSDPTLVDELGQALRRIREASSDQQRDEAIHEADDRILDLVGLSRHDLT